jgi:putative membrane protein
MYLFIKWILSALSFLLVAYFVPGIAIAGFGTSLVVALFWGILGVTLRPLFLLLTLPINILTLGLFTFVINGFFLLLLSQIVKGFSVSGFPPAFLGALGLSLVHWALHLVFRK